MVIIRGRDRPFRKFLKVFLIIIVAVIVLDFLLDVAAGDNFLGPDILVVPVEGEISLQSSGGLFSAASLSADEIVDQIESASRDPSIVAVILEINTPGGTVVASEDVAKAVAASDKPVVAWMREAATSGGYWIAASADEIVADPATITGSIGVTGSYLSFNDLFDEYGVKYERLVSGQYKDTGTPYRDLSQTERNLLQSKITRINEMFIQHISDSRGMPVEDVRRLATGEIFLGSEALELGLVDTLGGREEAVNAAETLAGVADAGIVRYEKHVGILDRLSALTSIDITIEPKSSFSINS